MLRLVLILNSVFLGVLTNTIGPECKLDADCVTKNAIDIFKLNLKDANNQLDPLYVQLIEENSQTIKYSLTDSTVSGFSKCNVKKANYDLEKVIIDVELYCPEIHIEGKYVIDGSLLGRPVEGNGEYIVDAKALEIKGRFEGSITLKDDKHYLQINKFNVDATALGDLIFNLKDEQKDMGDIVKFINANSKAVVKEVQGPVLRAKYKNIIEISNKVLEVTPLETFFIF